MASGLESNPTMVLLRVWEVVSLPASIMVPLIVNYGRKAGVGGGDEGTRCRWLGFRRFRVFRNRIGRILFPRNEVLFHPQFPSSFDPRRV